MLDIISNPQKELWEKLAKENSLYYINSDKGKGITHDEFRKSGRDAFVQFIVDDPVFKFGGTIVEIGCGIGRMTEFMTLKFEEVIGLDISGEMIRQAKGRLGYVEGIRFIETDGETIPLPDNFVNYVFSYLVFQHIKSREMVENNFKEVQRVLRSDGLFKVLLRTDKQDNMNKWWAGVHYDKQSIYDLCKRTGLKVFKLEFVKTYAVWLWATK